MDRPPPTHLTISTNRFEVAQRLVFSQARNYQYCRAFRLSAFEYDLILDSSQDSPLYFHQHMSELNNTFTRPPSGFQGHKRSKFSSRGHQTQGAIQRLQSNCLQSLNNRKSMTHTWLGLLCTRRCIIDNFIWIVYYYLFTLLLLWNIVKNKSFCSIIILNYFLFNQIRLNHWFKIGLKI